jgi:hypothetical protein
MTARLVGLALVALGVVVFLTAVLAAVLGLSPAVLMVVAVLGLVAVAGAAMWLRRRVVVHLDEAGYRVRMVRGVGVAAAPWTDVEELVTRHAAGAPCVVLRLRDRRTSTIPVTALGVDKEEFVRDLQRHLQQAHGLRRL